MWQILLNLRLLALRWLCARCAPIPPCHSGSLPSTHGDIALCLQLSLTNKQETRNIKKYKKVSAVQWQWRDSPKKKKSSLGLRVKISCKVSIVSVDFMLTWYDLKEVLSRVIWIRGEFVNFTEAQLDDSLQARSYRHKHTQNYKVLHCQEPTSAIHTHTYIYPLKSSWYPCCVRGGKA